jgi:selenide,water dikinase
MPETERLLLADAQTSGGLLIAVPEGSEQALQERLAEHGARAWRVGRVHEGAAGSIAVRGRLRV